jgi:asparagine synthase (glutamine-hydrolysing)
MPGIVGFISKLPREQAEPRLSRMVQTLRHAPSYVTGTWIDEELGVYVGWAARKGSFADELPQRDERNEVLLFFSGEEFLAPGTINTSNAREREIAEKGPSYLVHWYKEDAEFPKGLNGRFHGLIVDRTRGAAALFNDRYGLQRLYFHESSEAFYFAAEAKAILAVCPELRVADPRGLGEFVSCGCVLEGRTLFKGIDVLPLASAWTFATSRLSSEKLISSHKNGNARLPWNRKNTIRSFARPSPGFSLNISTGRNGLGCRLLVAWIRG